MKNIIVPANEAWKFGVETVFAGGEEKIAQGNSSVFIEGFPDNDENDVGFGISVRRDGVEIWWEYAHSPEQCEEIVANIYLAFIAEEIREPWTA